MFTDDTTFSQEPPNNPTTQPIGNQGSGGVKEAGGVKETGGVKLMDKMLKAGASSRTTPTTH